MTDTTMAFAPGEMRIGRVFGRAFEVLFRDFVKFFLLALVAWLPFVLVMIYGATSHARAGSGPHGGNFAAIIVGGLLTGLQWMVLSEISQAVILYGAFQRMQGRPFQIGASLGRGLARLPPIVALSIVQTIATGFAGLLLVFPAFILLSMWYVALPSCVVERLGPFDSLGRSSELTKGYCWKIFGIFILLFIGNLIAQSVIQFILTRIGGPIVASVGLFAWMALVGGFNSIIVAVLYHDLRVAKEGIDIEHIAAVFD